MTEIQCKGHTSTLSPKQEEFLSRARSRKMPFAYFDCPTCKRSVKLDLAEVGSAKPVTPTLRCPRPHCSGWIFNIEDLEVAKTPERWGCGECGVTWTNDAALFQAVSAIVARFPYRAKVYQREGKAWTGVPLKDQPSEYDATVEQEPWE